MPPRTPPPARRRPRADARDNHARILAAAQARLATEGLNASMDDIARDAGVAVGTLYHHFGTKTALLEAVVHDGLRRLEEFLRAQAADPDPGAALARMLLYFAEQQQRDRTFKALLGSQPELRAATTAAKRKLEPWMRQVIERAKAAGAARADLAPADIPLLLGGLAEVELTPAARERYVRIILDGLRPQ